MIIQFWLEYQMKDNKKPFYGLINFTRANLVTVILIVVGIIILFFHLFLGIIIFLLGIYSLLSFVFSTYSIHPTRSIDFSSMLDLDGNELVLDVGCGLGRATVGVAKLLKTGKVIGVDIWDKIEVIGNSPEKAYKNAEKEGIKDNIEFRHGDVFNLPFEDFYFDVVICSGLITSFHSDEQKIKAMKEIYRVLKRNGTFLMREPVKKLKSLIILTPDILLIKMPSKNHWIKLLEKSGFKYKNYYSHRIAGSFKMIKP